MKLYGICEKSADAVVAVTQPEKSHRDDFTRYRNNSVKTVLLLNMAGLNGQLKFVLTRNRENINIKYNSENKIIVL